MELKDKVVLITGSSSGIGEATAYKFAQKGAKIIVNCKSNITGAQKVVNNIKKSGGEAVYIQADVANPQDVERLFAETINTFKKLDILINNAGSTDKKPFLQSSKDEFIEIFNDNIFGTMLCSQKAAEIMKKQGYGKILNTSSIRGLEQSGREGIMAYSAAKAAVINFTKTLAKLLAPNIQVNSVAPGFVYTPNYDKMPEETKKSFIDGTLLKRWIKVEEIADAFVYLAEADAITGEVLVVDAGWSLKF